jgi:cytochrome c553
VSIQRWLVTAAGLLAFAALAGALAVASGIVPITASSGHFALTERLLVFAKRRSIATHTWGEPPPPLDDPALVLKGAGHYEAGCRPCHGAPDLPRLPRVPRAMLPPPPDLSVIVFEYEPEELFYIVKHGIEFTGMPAWPSQVRDDEVGALVAFLVKLPGFDAAAYRRLVYGDSPPAGAGAPEALGVLVGAERAPRAVVARCGRCHGLDGRGRGNAAFPALAGQREQYLVASLEAFAADRRQSGIMQPMAAALSADEMRELAAYYSRLPARRTRGAASGVVTHTGGADGADSSGSAGPGADVAALERGRAIVERGIPDRRVPSCSDCHGPADAPKSAAVPALAGQYADYLVLQLQLLHDKHRGGTDRVHLMDEVAPRLTPEQMHDVAQYYESLEP